MELQGHAAARMWLTVLILYLHLVVTTPEHSPIHVELPVRFTGEGDVREVTKKVFGVCATQH